MANREPAEVVPVYATRPQGRPANYRTLLLPLLCALILAVLAGIGGLLATGTSQWSELGVLLLVLAGLAVGLWALLIPCRVARRRLHPAADAITLLVAIAGALLPCAPFIAAMLGVTLLGPVLLAAAIWLAAALWAYSRPDTHQLARPIDSSQDRPL